MTQKQQAEALGLTRTTYLHRLKHGIPLDAPVMTPKQRALHARGIRVEQLIAERAERMVWQAKEAERRREREKLERQWRRERERKLREAQRRREQRDRERQAAAEARRQREEAYCTITAAPRKHWANPFALLAGARSRTGASRMASSTSSGSGTGR
jgi:hypothetical protein